jgi:tripartite-type tricarboxylate transporter receptor subunit TctC
VKGSASFLKKRSKKLLSVILLTLAIATHARAEDYPTKPLSLIVPFPAGGRTDLVARIVAQNLQIAIGQSVLVVNRPGASGVLGANAVAEAVPDGYTVGFFSSGVVTAQYTVPTPISLTKFDLVAIVNADPAAIAVNAAAPWQSLKDLVIYGREHPGQLRAGIIPGASAQIFGAGFARAAGVSMINVPFKGDADGAIALAGGHIDVHFAVPVAYKALADSGKVRVLAIAADARSPLYGDIPTCKENGVDLSIAAFHGVFVPKGTDLVLREKLAKALHTALASPALQERMNDTGAAVVFLDGSAAQSYLEQQDATYRSIIDALGLRAPQG